MFDTRVDELIGARVTESGGTSVAELDGMQPGPFLAIAVSGIDLDGLSVEDRIVVLRAYQRLSSHYTAQVYAAMVSVVDSFENDEGYDRCWACEATAHELRCALHLTRRSADVEVSFAVDLCERLPRVWEALLEGLIDRPRARTIVWQTTHLTDDEARAVVDRIIDRAPELTTGQLVAQIRKLAVAVDPEAATRRQQRAVEDRRVVTEATDACTANLLALDLPPGRAAAVSHRINEIARTLHGPHESRTMDQLRADVFLDLLTGTKSAGKGATVDIRVELDILAGLSEASGDLAGYGPVIADIARQVADDQHKATWRYTVVDDGMPIATGTTRRRPTAAQQRFVEATHPTCVFPGCRVTATECDLDHTIAWKDGGPTTTGNLAPLCRHDHTMRHKLGWTYQILANNDIEWTSPTG
ncbi:MAG: DUF222 domain-containing protein, partial [Actinomycetota bacterium]